MTDKVSACMPYAMRYRLATAHQRQQGANAALLCCECRPDTFSAVRPSVRTSQISQTHRRTRLKGQRYHTQTFLSNHVPSAQAGP